MSEEIKSEKNEGKITIKLPKFNLWILISLVLAVVLILSLVKGWSLTGKVSGTLSPTAAANKAIDYINANLVQSGTSATLNSTEDAGSVYKIIFSYQGNQYTFYITKDGTYLSQYVWDTSEKIQQSSTQTQQQEIPKADKPVADLYVMSFCPYGTQAEQAMKPVVDLLGSKATIEPHFILYDNYCTGGGCNSSDYCLDGDNLCSMHGTYEAKEDERQACIWKNYGQTIFWKYVDYLNSNCNKNNIDTCWKDAAKSAGIDTTKIETCVTSEGLDLMKAEQVLSTKNGVSGSPTLIINGVEYNGDRTAEAYKQAICNATTTPPAECSQTLSSSGSATSSGGCG
jgi:glutaredoxin